MDQFRKFSYQPNIVFFPILKIPFEKENKLRGYDAISLYYLLVFKTATELKNLNQSRFYCQKKANHLRKHFNVRYTIFQKKIKFYPRVKLLLRNINGRIILVFKSSNNSLSLLLSVTQALSLSFSFILCSSFVNASLASDQHSGECTFFAKFLCPCFRSNICYL